VNVNSLPATARLRLTEALESRETMPQAMKELDAARSAIVEFFGQAAGATSGKGNAVLNQYMLRLEGHLNPND
jgi:hypothetical protein